MINKAIISYQKFLDEHIGNGPIIVFFIVFVIMLAGWFLNGTNLAADFYTQIK